MKEADISTHIPTKIIENLTFTFNKISYQIDVPISTYETPLFYSIQRGAKVSQKSPINIAILNDCMTRSAIFQCENIADMQAFLKIIDKKRAQNDYFQNIINQTSKHCHLLKIENQVIGNLVYIRFSYDTSEASGHNMTTIATNDISKELVKLAKNNNLDVLYISNSGNTCIDKKVSAINSISGRGKHVVAEINISRQICEEILHTTPEKIVELNTKKNLLGSILAGSLCSANAHYANMLASIFLPLGQDIANIVEASQGITYCEVKNSNLYFSVNLPNIICGCVGNGKNLNFVQKNLQLIGCLDENIKPIKNASQLLSGIIGSVVLCGELSLLSALTNQDELTKSHKAIERHKIYFFQYSS